METPIDHVHRDGAAGDAAHHWWTERMTSLASLLLLVWFLVSLFRLPRLDHATVTEWLSLPLAAVPMLLLIVATFWHLMLGLRVIVEDYVHDEGNKMGTLVVINFASIIAAAFAIFAVLKIAFGGDAS